MQAYSPRDATTNPSLILKAVQKPEYQHLLEDVIQKHKGQSSGEIIDHLLIAFGRQILNIIPGRVSTETDARLSFDTEGTIAKARHLIALYEAAGVARERVLIKIASTWEGIRAADVLEKENIRCNMTLLFSLPQAIGQQGSGLKLNVAVSCIMRDAPARSVQPLRRRACDPRAGPRAQAVCARLALCRAPHPIGRSC